jgi:hypothetical protein
MFSRVSARLTRDSTFFGVLAGLLLLAAVPLFWFRHDFAAVPRVLVPGDHEVARWQAWARHYDRLFGMLGEGERVAVQLAGNRSSGILLERRPEGMVARRSLFLRREHPGIVLSLERGAAEGLLDSVPQTDPEQIWQMMKDRLYDRKITVWSDPDLDRLQRGGYLAFLRAIDTRPSGVDWPTVKARLGEK